jgi:hypothetical protein
MNILYMRVRGVIGGTGRAMRAQGHKLVLRSECVEALESIRHETFGAVVIEDDNQDAEILHFTVEAHQTTRLLRSLLQVRGGMAFLGQSNNSGALLKTPEITRPSLP